jgi:hypothetical protein
LRAHSAAADIELPLIKERLKDPTEVVEEAAFIRQRAGALVLDIS